MVFCCRKTHTKSDTLKEQASVNEKTSSLPYQPGMVEFLGRVYMPVRWLGPYEYLRLRIYAFTHTPPTSIVA